MADKHKILIVEDDKYIINFISMSLKKEDYDFVIAKTCGEAVHIPYKSLEHNLILKMCKKCTECLWCQFFTDDNT